MNSKLNDNEVLYMHHPPGYKSPDAGNCVLCLKKTSYGLKQSGCRWYQNLSSIFSELGFSCCSVDQAIFYKSSKDKKEIMVIMVHINDCTITVSSLHLIKDFKASLCKHIGVTDLSELHWMLGLEIKQDQEARTIHILQCAYINSILRHFHFNNLKPLSIPIDTFF